MRVLAATEEKVAADTGHLEDILLASSKMTGSERRAFQAELALNPLLLGRSARRGRFRMESAGRATWSA